MSNTSAEVRAILEKGGGRPWEIRVTAPDGTSEAVDWWGMPQDTDEQVVAGLRVTAQLVVTAWKERLGEERI